MNGQPKTEQRIHSHSISVYFCRERNACFCQGYTMSLIRRLPYQRRAAMLIHARYIGDTCLRRPFTYQTELRQLRKI